MTRAERRAVAHRLAEEYRVTVHLAFRAVQAGVHNRCAALATGADNPGQAFLAAAQVLTRRNHASR